MSRSRDDGSERDVCRAGQYSSCNISAVRFLSASFCQHRIPLIVFGATRFDRCAGINGHLAGRVVTLDARNRQPSLTRGADKPLCFGLPEPVAAAGFGLLGLFGWGRLYLGFHGLLPPI